MIAVLAAIIWAWASIANAATYYVATTGNDTTGTGTIGAPWLTVAKGLRSLSAGDTLYIRAGTYVVSSVYGNVAGDSYGGGAASWAGATSIRNYPGETVVVQSRGFNMDHSISTGGISYIIWEGDSRSNFIFERTGSNNDSGFRVNNAAHHVRFKTLTVRNFLEHGIQGGTGGCSGSVAPANIEILDSLITNNGDDTFLEHGIYPSCSENWLIEGNSIVGNQGYGIHVYASTANWHRSVTIRNNYIEGRKSGATGTAYCIVIATGSGHVVYNNICNGIGGQSVKYSGGIQIYGSMTAPKIYNNTIYDVGTGVQVGDSGVSSADIKNNIFETVTTPVSDSGTSTTRSNNFCDSAGTGCSVTGSPSFTNAATNDFTLQSGSNCRDAGADLSATLTTDYAGVARPQNSVFDIGAYEYIVSSGGGGQQQSPPWSSPRRNPLFMR